MATFEEAGVATNETTPTPSAGATP
jgi:hypothetical protein